MLLRHRRALACIGVIALFCTGILAACSDDESPGAATDDAGDERAVDGPAPDAPASGGDSSFDAGADAPSDALADAVADATTDADAGDAADADAGPMCPVVAELVSPASSPWGVAVKNGIVSWTEPNTPGVRRCATSGCASLPPNMITASAGVTLPFGVVGDNGRLFFTDNQCSGCGLFTVPFDGGPRAKWGFVSANGAGAVVSGDSIMWGNSYGLYRTLLADGGDTQIMTGSITGEVANGPHSVAVDNAHVYAAPGGATIVSCALGQSCADGGGLTTIATVTKDSSNNVEGIAADGTSVFFTDGLRYDVSGSGKERLSRCPTTGCPSATPEVLYEATANGPSATSSQMGVVVDATNVYWGSLNLKILRCAKNAVAPCTPATVVSGVRPFGMALDGDCLYWAETGGGSIGGPGIYRIKVP